MSRIYLLAVLAALLLIAPQVPAQDSQEGASEDTPYFDVLDVEIVNIDVWVTDKQGNPIDGLTADDFIVLRDGEPVEIANFYAVAGDPRLPGRQVDPAVPEAERKPSLTPDELEEAANHRLWMIVYIDNYNIHPIERNRIFPAVRQFLGRTLRGDDQAMLVTYMRSLKVKQPFTSESAVLGAALDDLIDDAGHATIRRRDMMDAIKRIDESDSARQALLYARQYAEERMNGVQYTVDALKRLIDSLAGLPGRKALVHVSSGIPMTAGEEAFHTVAEKFDISEAYAEIPRHDTSRRFESVTQHANAHRVSFYTVDAGGLRGLEFGNAEYGGFSDPRIRSTLDSVVPENLQAPLHLLAIETGGRAIVNQNEILPALVKASQDFRSFYSLGISSAHTRAGRYHEVKVKLREPRKGVRIRHRAGYRSKNTDTRVRESLRSALLYSHQDNPDGVQVIWGEPTPQSDSTNYVLPIQLRIPLQDVVLLPTAAGKHEARLRLYVGAVGEESSTSPIDTAPLGVRLAEEHVEAAKKESLLHTHKLLLSPGRKMVGIAVLDLFGRETSVITRSIQVGPAADSG